MGPDSVDRRAYPGGEDFRKRPSAENASLAGAARPRRGGGPSPAAFIGWDCLQIVRAGVTGAPLGGAKIENFGLLYVDYATQQAHAEAERIVLPGGRRAKPAGVIRSRRPGGRWTGRPYAEECGVASNSGCDHHDARARRSTHYARYKWARPALSNYAAPS